MTRSHASHATSSIRPQASVPAAVTTPSQAAVALDDPLDGRDRGGGVGEVDELVVEVVPGPVEVERHGRAARLRDGPRDGGAQTGRGAGHEDRAEVRRVLAAVVEDREERGVSRRHWGWPPG